LSFSTEMMTLALVTLSTWAIARSTLLVT